ncbi:MAG: hypothetical protein DRN06_08465 [Thermoprotei archaeon]|nr:MAG: hypothetical protein DRN06_08465 [Thermoprotei archaeon]
MQFTVRAKLLPDEDDEIKLSTLSRVFPSMVRFAYNRLIEEHKTYDVVRMLYDKFIPNARWCQWAVKEAQAVINSQKELLPLYVEDLKWRLERARKRLSKTRHPLKRAGIKKKIKKLERRLKELEAHVNNNTIPRAVFGTKRLLRKLSKGRDVREEWIIRRRWGFLSIGQRNQKGNANTRIIKEGGEYWLLVRNTMFPDFKVKMYIPQEFRPYIDELLASSKPYTIRVKRTLKHGYQVFIAFELKEPNVEWNGRKIAGIDINPLGIAVTIVSRDGNLLASKWFSCPDLVYARRGKRNWLIGNLVKKAFRWLRGHGVNTIAVEDLNIKKTPDYPPQVNRLIANFVRKRLAQTIRSRAIREGFLLIKVQPAYTSKIARLKYGRMFPRFNTHQLAGFIIARRALGHGEKLPKAIGITYKIGKRKRRIKVRYIWASLYGYSLHELMVGGGSDGRMSSPTKAHGDCNRRVTPHSPLPSYPRLLDERVRLGRMPTR